MKDSPKKNITLSQARHLIQESLDTQNPYLELGKCGITDLNDIPELFECTHLETLILSDLWYNDFVRRDVHKSTNKGKRNKLSFIPKEIGNLKKLTTLIIAGELDNKWEISEIGHLNQLENLRFLNLDDNSIPYLAGLEKFKSLHTLLAISNNIETIEILENIPHLKSLNLGWNMTSDINFLNNLPGLQFLNLGTSRVQDFNLIGTLTELRHLDLRANSISDASFLKNLTKLEFLNLSKNNIKDVSFLNQLSSLKKLILVDNQIEELPLYIFQLNMEIISGEFFPQDGMVLENNPMKSPPIEIINQGRKSVLDWFEARKKKLDEIKIILIGDPKAGKTSLLRMLKDGKFDESEVQTDGINIEHVQFGSCKTFEAQKSLHNLTAHFWDFGGQEIMNATHQFFLTNRSVYVLVLDARKDVNVTLQIRQWVKRIKTTGGNSPIIVVANQSDINAAFGFTNEHELKQEFPQLKYFIKTSCKIEENIDLLKKRLEELIPEAELFNTEIDERWIHIKDQLQKETKTNHFLDETRFIEICKKYELTGKDSRKNAINFLNDLGLVLHFEDLNLAEYYVLDPYWITYGVYQILTSSYAGKAKGKVSMDKLEFIVNDEEDKKETYRPVNYKKITYSNNERRFLVDILNQFKLSFYLPGDKYFIIPDLLDTSEPIKLTDQIRNNKESIRFVYEYVYLPNSVLPNIMVETHQILKEMWRTGCVLENDGCKALISNYQNRISIIVTGEHKKKREFMAVIRYIIDSINHELSDKPKELIPLDGLNAFADYEVLLTREKKGKKNYILDEDKPTEREFEISVLLEGIPTQDEVLGIKEIVQKVLTNTEILKEGQQEIKNKLDQHYQYLIQRPENNKIKDEILIAIKEINTNQTAEITGEIMQWITTAFEHFDGDMDEKLNEIYTDLKKTDNVDMKLTLGVPLINLLGINLETSFDVKSWASKMYQKYKLKIFKLISVNKK
jgi:small GTP-binding protein